MNLDAYFKRIGYRGPRQASLATLRAVHRCHALNIAYENLDVVLERPVDQNIERIFDKIVHKGRGGWCYEMNGLLGWAFTEIGFDVTRVCAGVMRSERGDAAFGNHLMLSIDLGEPWIADLGLGDGILEPVLLHPGPTEQGSRRFSFEVLADNKWRFHNYPGAIPADFDFVHKPADEALIAQTCETLQIDPKSMFRQNLVCQQMAETGTCSLLGRVLTKPSGERQLLNSATELATTLEKQFRIDLREILPELENLWERVAERHRTVFGDTPVADISFGPG